MFIYGASTTNKVYSSAWHILDSYASLGCINYATAAISMCTEWYSMSISGNF